MAVSGVGKVGYVAQQTKTTNEQQELLRRRLELYRESSFERRSTSNFDPGTVRLGVDAETQASIGAFYARFPVSSQALIRGASTELGAAIINAGPVRAPTAAITSAATSALTTYMAHKGQNSMAAANQDFTYMALSGMENTLMTYANRNQSIIDNTKMLREEMTELGDMISDWPEGETQEYTWKEIGYDDKGMATVTEHTETLTKDDAMQLREKLEKQKETANDLGELAKFDLQRVYEDYQQAVSTLANILKQVYDDAMKVIGNMRS